MKNLSKLYIAGNQIESLDNLAALMSLPNLRNLDLENNPIVEDIARFYSGERDIENYRQK